MKRFLANFFGNYVGGVFHPSVKKFFFVLFSGTALAGLIGIIIAGKLTEAGATGILTGVGAVYAYGKHVDNEAAK